MHFHNKIYREKPVGGREGRLQPLHLPHVSVLIRTTVVKLCIIDQCTRLDYRAVMTYKHFDNPIPLLSVSTFKQFDVSSVIIIAPADLLLSSVSDSHTREPRQRIESYNALVNRRVLAIVIKINDGDCHNAIVINWCAYEERSHASISDYKDGEHTVNLLLRKSVESF